ALASVSLSEDTEISLDGMVTWFKLCQIPGLLNALDAFSSVEFAEQDVKPVSQSSNEKLSGIISHIQELAVVGKLPFNRVFPTKEAELDFVISEYHHIFDTLLSLAKELCDACCNASLSRKVISLITGTVNGVASKINNRYMYELKRLSADNNTFTTSNIITGHTRFSLLHPLDDVNICRNDFLSVLGDKNLCVTYDKGSEDRAIDFVNMVIGKLYAGNPAHAIITNVVDTDYMTGLDDSFKLLDKDIYNVISRTDEVRNLLLSLQERASVIIRNLLVKKDLTLRNYNSTHENKEPNILLVLKNFPHGLRADALEVLRRLATVGPKVGIYIVILSSNDGIDGMTDGETDAFDLDSFRNTASVYNFNDSTNNVLGVLKISDDTDILESDISFDVLSESDLRQIVKEVNSRCELREDTVVSVSDFIPDMSEWWSSCSANRVEIPFGISGNNDLATLSITQQSGQNSAVVVGIPGSGKSVFLHTIICNVAMKYSPEELELYLMDFSGVEFNTYAEHKLPHAKVIAPEAEREFGLSILNRLKEEGERRMALCRNYSTAKDKISSIVDLKRLHPELHCPRILVIIDEFQKLFENETDAISKQAQVIIQIIIKEFRKFGINLILATQKLSDLSNGLLPRDLIANRIVFRCSPTDLPLIGESTMPLLSTGQCIYNAESGVKDANDKVQTFYIDNNSMDSILTNLYIHAESIGQLQNDSIVFHSSELPDFRSRRPTIKPQVVPASVVVHIGEPIAISTTDVCASVNQTSNDNILVIGGEPSVAEATAYFMTNSVISQYSDFAAKFYLFNFLRNETNPLTNVINDTFHHLDDAFDYVCATRQDDVIAALQEIKSEIESRIADEGQTQKHIWLSIYGFQYAQAFKLGGRRGDTVSEAGQLMRFILNSGPLVGVFTILQVDNELNLRQLESNVTNFFEHRVVFQMDESGSNHIIGSDVASRLYVVNRPSSVFRGYYYNKHNRILNKFKPYSMQNGDYKIPFLLNR
ncbi:MAG: hypothetical protein K2J00_07750, partial [Bacteroidaceae bacterium]|nr:hypothetical protein [Bacteroidaceae bacterium]